MTGSSTAENRSNMSGEKQRLRMMLLKPRRSESDCNEPLPQFVESQGSLFGDEAEDLVDVMKYNCSKWEDIVFAYGELFAYGHGTLCVSLPEFGGAVVSLVKSLLQRNVLPGLDLSINGDAGDEYSRPLALWDGMKIVKVQWVWNGNFVYRMGLEMA
ncbi:hypothetical protein FCV25MIE_21968 [Fagus crenata]